MERKSNEHYICNTCNKNYIIFKWFLKHTESCDKNKMNIKVVKKKKIIKCNVCSYESDRKSSIDK